VTGWARGREEIAGMLERGELSQITANAELAERLLATARQHLASARLLGWLARPAGFEPATRCLEGSCSVRLSYGRPQTIVPGKSHTSAT
jgi:hypothetical protein